MPWQAAALRLQTAGARAREALLGLFAGQGRAGGVRYEVADLEPILAEAETELRAMVGIRGYRAAK
jgi:hypothetical protein